MANPGGAAATSQPMDKRSKSVPPGWVAALDGWAVAMRAAARSRATITTRTDHLRRAARALGGDPWAVTGAQLLGWVGRADWSPETRRSVYASLRSFWRWGADAGHLTGPGPAAVLPRVAPADPMPRPTPEPVYSAAVRAADARGQLILRLAAECGLRRAEIAQVHARDLVEDLAGWSLVVHGKGGRDRLVPMPVALALDVRTQLLAAGGGWLFPGGDGGHLSARWVGKLATQLLPGDWTLHTLRHRCATVAAELDHNLVGVRQLLGHRSVATTQRYVAVRSDQLRQLVERAGDRRPAA